MGRGLGCVSALAATVGFVFLLQQHGEADQIVIAVDRLLFSTGLKRAIDPFSSRRLDGV